jgi:mono/diheme cytochrome c family protein
MALQLTADQPSDGPGFLSGADVEGYFAPSLRSGGAGTLGDWDVPQLAQFLLTGANGKAISFASMSDVITHSTQFMTPADATEVAAFLKSLIDTRVPVPAFGYDAATATALRHGDASARGARAYLDNCAACHRPDGKGYAGVFPALAGNPVVRTIDPSSSISIILNGSVTPRTASAPARFSMPQFAWRLSDRDVADVVTFIRASWGNDASPVDSTEVRALRDRIPR